MTTIFCLRRFLADYARNPVNLLMLVIVPVVFVAVAAPSMAASAQLLGGAGGGPPVETATAGWAAGFLAGIAMYFQVAAARNVDRRLVLAGMGSTRLITARLGTGLALAGLVSAVALVILAARTGIDSPIRVVIGTLMFAAVYVGLGAMVGAFGVLKATTGVGGRKAGRAKPGTMTPMAIASLAMLAGVFIVVDAASADQRLHLAGMRTGVMLTARLTVVAAAVGLSTVVALAVTATVFTPQQWVTYIVANLLIAVTFGLFGVLIGPVFGRVSGAFLSFVIPFLDLGISQSPMLRGTPPTWTHYLPGYAGIRILVDSSVTVGFDEASAVLLALGWIAVLAVGAALVFRHMITTAARPRGPLGIATT